MTQIDPVYFLLVDDLEENLLSLEALLRRDGLVILKASSGHAALELMLQHDVALAFLDVQMPGMDGFELAELMRGIEKTRQVPIIFLTAGTTDYQRRFRGYEAGAVDFLQKPIESDIVKSKAQVFYDLYRQRQKIAILLQESQTYSQALKEADRRKDEFLATLAHELRNPLAPIRNGLALLNESANAAQLREVKGIMERQLLHLIHLIDDLLDVSRVQNGKIELKKETISIQTVLQTAIETSQPMIDAKKHNLNVNLPDKPVWVYGDPTRLAQIFSNVLNNAAKYTGSGGNIVIYSRQHENELVISIADNGIGIPPTMLPKVFDLFTQVENNFEHSQGGLGIGLALVQRLVSMHGGTISANSEGEGLGSIFIITLPTVSAVQQDKDEPVQPAEVPAGLSPQRILVVDDNVDSAKTTGWMLEAMGHDYQLAFDGESAITTAKSYRPNIIMLDIGLPKINGYDVCRMLRADCDFRDSVFIAQTGWGQKKDRLLADEAGFNHHMVKPLDFEKLSELITQITMSGS